MASRQLQRQLKQVYQRKQLRHEGLYFGASSTNNALARQFRLLSVTGGGEDDNKDHSLPDEGEHTTMAHGIDLVSKEPDSTETPTKDINLSDGGDITASSESTNPDEAQASEITTKATTSAGQISRLYGSTSKSSAFAALDTSKEDSNLNEEVQLPRLAGLSETPHARANNPMYMQAKWKRSHAKARALHRPPKKVAEIEKQSRMNYQNIRWGQVDTGTTKLSNSVAADSSEANSSPTEADLPTLAGISGTPRARASSPNYLKEKWEKSHEKAKLHKNVRMQAAAKILESEQVSLNHRQRSQGPTRFGYPGGKYSVPHYGRPKSIAKVLHQLNPRESNVPRNGWILVTGVPPVSNLESMLQGINQALDRALVEKGGFTDLDANWDPRMGEGEMPLPMLAYQDIFPQHSADYPKEDLHRWVQEARVVLSAYGRPHGWKIRLANKSIAHALLQSTNEKPLMCSWKEVAATPLNRKAHQYLYQVLPTKGDVVRISFENQKRPTPEEVEQGAIEPMGSNHLFYDDLDTRDLDWLDDSVVRVENCCESTDEQDLLFMFSRYDLKAPSVLQWTGRQGTDNEKGSGSPMFFVRFADADWARAAVRAKQGTTIGHKSVRLIQFPKQYIPQVSEGQQPYLEELYREEQHA